MQSLNGPFDDKGQAVDSAAQTTLSPATHQAKANRNLAVRLILAALLFVAIEALVFHTHFYSDVLAPDSAAGSLKLNLDEEARRPRNGPNQVLGIGDSRMGLWRRATDPQLGEVGYTFANIATPGTYPRCWYYMLREVDPHRNRYAAIAIAMNEYEDDDWGDHSSADADIHYLTSLLRMTDLFEFGMSFPTWKQRKKAMLSILLKGLTYKRDFQDLLVNHEARFKEIGWIPQNLAKARYDYVGPSTSVAGLEVDWTARKIVRYPPNSTPGEQMEFVNTLLRPTANCTGQRAAYRRQWFGKILEYYRGTRTRIVFFRMPRGPVVRPYPMSTQSSLVREFAARGEALLLDEHTFDALERPEFFMDPVHLNGPGCERFSQMLARAVGRALPQSDAR